MTRHVVARVDEIAPATSKLVVVEGREIGIYNVNGEYYALLNRCPHQGGPLCQGRITGLVLSSQPGEFNMTRKGEIVRCPWHGWEFDIKTGQSWCDPKKVFTRRYDVSVEAGEALVKGPYVADTFAVTIENNYVVLEL